MSGLVHGLVIVVSTWAIVPIRVVASVAVIGAILIASAEAAAQAQPSWRGAEKSIPVPADYVIGADDILTITVYGQDPTFRMGDRNRSQLDLARRSVDLVSVDVTVRPDGKIARLLKDEIQAAGLTPLQLMAELTKAYAKSFDDPVVRVAVKQINSRKVSITGTVGKPGEYPLTESMDLLQLIVKAGGVQGSIETSDIRILRRRPDGSTETIVFDARQLFAAPVTVPQLKPGDQVIVK